ncbi:MAG: type III pantothenate kinase [Sulfurovum sp.]|nr:type III pantothenate kinase [Sulfurovum sp.]
MILADIGNRHVHICSDEAVEHLLPDEAIKKYGDKAAYYISVKKAYNDMLAALDDWTDISDSIYIEGEYKGMGVDRKALCLSRDSGIFVDAGSAITVDRVIDGIYDGGFIMPGIHTYTKAFADISLILDHKLDKDIALEELPKSTQGSVSFGTVSPVIAIIEKIRADLPVYFTGGDGEWLSGYFKDAIFDERLLFDGMRKTVKGLKYANNRTP